MDRRKVRVGLSRRLHVLNVSDLTSQRGDGHCELCTPELPSGGVGVAIKGHPAHTLDCLHFCLPGPLDVWNVLLQADLRLTLQTKQQHK